MLWSIGYFRTKIATRTDEILLSPPHWVTILCGVPRPRGLPKGIIHAAGAWLQLTGWMVLIYGLLASKFYNNFIGFLAVIVGGLLTSRILTAVLVKKFRYLYTS
jgi:hypothetical protein